MLLKQKDYRVGLKSYIRLKHMYIVMNDYVTAFLNK